MRLPSTDILFASSMLIEERVVPHRVVEADHDRLATILRTQIEGAGTRLAFGDVLGWTAAEQNVETHAQIAPHADGSAIRLVVRGLPPDRPSWGLYLRLAVGLAILIGVLMYAAGTPHHRLALMTLCPLVLFPIAGVFDRRRCDQRVAKLRSTADALAEALARSERVPRTRVEDADAAPRADRIAPERRSR